MSRPLLPILPGHDGQNAATSLLGEGPWQHSPQGSVGIANDNSRQIVGTVSTTFTGPIANVHYYGPSRDDYAASAGEALSMIPYDRDHDFQGRDDILLQLKQGFKKYNRLAIHGIGGVGKTQIATEYAFRFLEEHPDNKVLWVHGADAVRFKRSYQAIASLLQIPGTDSEDAPLLTLVRAYLSTAKNGPWLLVLDNVDDISFFLEPYPTLNSVSNASYHDDKPLKAYLPMSPHGHILITSRNRGYAVDLLTVRSAACLIEVPLMTPEEGVELLKHRLPDDSGTDEDKLRLVTELEYLPLAIDQAAAYIIQDEGLTTVSSYLQKLRRGESSRISMLMESIQELSWEDTPKRSVLRAWDITFEHIQQHQPESAEILFKMSVYSSQAIPAGLLQYSLASGENLNKVLRPLIRFHLVKMHSGANLYHLHGFIQLATRTYLKEVIRRENDIRTAALCHLVDSLEDAPELAGFSDDSSYHHYIPHATELAHLQFTTRDDLINVSRLLGLVAAFWLNTWDPVKALDASSRSVEVISSVVQGPDDLPMAMCRRRALHGFCLAKVGRPKEGEIFMRDALEYLKHRCEETGWQNLGLISNMLECTYRLGGILMTQCRYYEAEECASRAVDLSKAYSGLDMKVVVKLEVVCCQSRVAQLKYAEAEESINEMVRRYDMVERYTDFAWIAKRLLIVIYDATDRDTKARKLLDEVQPQVISRHGEKSEVALTLLQIRASLDYDLDLICHVLAAAKEMYGSINHFICFDILNYKRDILMHLNRCEEASEVVEEILQIFGKPWGLSDPRILKTTAYAAIQYYEMGQYQTGLDRLRSHFESIGDTITALPLADVIFARTIEAQCLERLGQGEAALNLFTECSQLMKSECAPVALRIICNTRLVDYLVDRDLFDRALIYVEESLELLKPATYESDSAAYRMRTKQALCLEKASSTATAESLLRENAIKAENTLGKDHDIHQEITLAYAEFLKRQGRFEEAEELYKALLEARSNSKSLGSHHRETLKIRNELGHLYRAWSKEELAVSYERETLRLRQKHLPDGHVDILTSLNNLAMSLYDLREYEEAISLLEKVVEPALEKLGICATTDLYRDNILSVRIAQSNWKTAEDLYEKSIASRASVYGLKHAKTLETFRKGLQIWRESCQWETLLAFGDEMLKSHVEVLGEDDTFAQNVSSDIGLAHLRLGAIERAEEIFRKIYAKAMEGKLPVHDIGMFSFRYAELLRLENRNEDLEIAARNLTEVIVRVHGGTDEETSSTQLVLCMALQGQKRFLEAARIQHLLCMAQDSGQDLTSRAFYVNSLKLFFHLLGQSIHLETEDERMVLDWRAKVLLFDHDTMNTHVLLLSMARALRNHEMGDATEIYRICLGVLESKPNQTVSEILTIKFELQSQLYFDGDLEGAVRLGTEIKDAWEDAQHLDRTIVIPSLFYTNLGYSFLDYGMVYDAEVLGYKLYRESVEKHGDEHIETLLAQRLWAKAQFDCGQYKQATNTMRYLLQKHESTPQADTIVLAILQTNLARALLQQGSYVEAKDLLEQPFIYSSSFSGPRKRRHLAQQGYLAVALHKLGESDRARYLARETLDRTKQLLGSAHPQTLRCQLHLSEQYLGTCELPEAEQLAMSGVVLSKRLSSAHTHPLTIEFLDLLGRIYLAQTRISCALVVFRRAWPACNEHFRPDHPVRQLAEQRFVLTFIQWSRA